MIKIEKAGMIELHLPSRKNNEEEVIPSMYTPTKFMMEHNIIGIKILPSFYRKYFWYNLVSFIDNKWNYINPFWILWKFIQATIFLVERLWNKSKIITIILGALGGVLVYDWSLAWKNIKIILDYFGFL